MGPLTRGIIEVIHENLPHSHESIDAMPFHSPIRMFRPALYSHDPAERNTFRIRPGIPCTYRTRLPNHPDAPWYREENQPPILPGSDPHQFIALITSLTAPTMVFLIAPQNLVTSAPTSPRTQTRR